MANLFLKVDKRFFFLGIDPFGIRILSQIDEYTSKGMTCFISNEQLAKQFGSSLSTVKRTIANLEKMEYLNRDTKNTSQGKERFLTLNQETIEKTYAKAQSELCQSARLTENFAQGSTCSLRKGQNGPIKDKCEEQTPLEEDKNKKDKLKAGQPQTSSEIPKEEKIKIDISKLPEVKKEEVVSAAKDRYILQDDNIRVFDTYKQIMYRIV